MCRLDVPSAGAYGAIPCGFRPRRPTIDVAPRRVTLVASRTVLALQRVIGAALKYHPNGSGAGLQIFFSLNSVAPPPASTASGWQGLGCQGGSGLREKRRRPCSPHHLPKQNRHSAFVLLHPSSNLRLPHLRLLKVRGAHQLMHMILVLPRRPWPANHNFTASSSRSRPSRKSPPPPHHHLASLLFRPV